MLRARASGGSDFLNGGPGRDNLQGFSQRGRDRLLGGGAPDRLGSRDGFPDDTVNGERGTDLFISDRGDTRRSCERRR